MADKQRVIPSCMDHHRSRQRRASATARRRSCAEGADESSSAQTGISRFSREIGIFCGKRDLRERCRNSAGQFGWFCSPTAFRRALRRAKRVVATTRLSFLYRRTFRGIANTSCTGLGLPPVRWTIFSSWNRMVLMARTRTSYPTEFREHINALSRSGRRVEALARKRLRFRQAPTSDLDAPCPVFGLVNRSQLVRPRSVPASQLAHTQHEKMA